MCIELVILVIIDIYKLILLIIDSYRRKELHIAAQPVINEDLAVCRELSAILIYVYGKVALGTSAHYVTFFDKVFFRIYILIIRCTGLLFTVKAELSGILKLLADAFKIKFESRFVAHLYSISNNDLVSAIRVKLFCCFSIDSEAEINSIRAFSCCDFTESGIVSIMTCCAFIFPCEITVIIAITRRCFINTAIISAVGNIFISLGKDIMYAYFLTCFKVLFILNLEKPEKRMIEIGVRIIIVCSSVISKNLFYR